MSIVIIVHGDCSVQVVERQYLVGVFGVQEHGGEQPQADDFLLALVLTDVAGEGIVVLAVVEPGRDALERLIAPFVFLRDKTK